MIFCEWLYLVFVNIKVYIMLLNMMVSVAVSKTFVG